MNKKERRNEIMWTWLLGVAILLIIWFIFSIVEVWHANDLYFRGEDYTYSTINFFQILSDLARR